MKRTVAQWSRTRAKLKTQFERWGITFCEVCGSTFNLSFAHRVKRRFINDEQELNTVALLCAEHHNDFEYGGHERMYEAITKIIEARNEQ